MRISAKAEYACVAMLELAANYADAQPVRIKAIADAQHALVPVNYIERVLQLARQGFTALQFEEYDTDWNSKAYFTVSGQNSNNSVRVDNPFMEAVRKDGAWPLYWRTEKAKAQRENRPAKPCKTIRARDLWDQIVYAAWSCADPARHLLRRIKSACERSSGSHRSSAA